MSKAIYIDTAQSLIMIARGARFNRYRFTHERAERLWNLRANFYHCDNYRPPYASWYYYNFFLAPKDTDKQ